MALMQHRRTWNLHLDDRPYRVEVIYKALSGWMSIEVDGVQVARGWREWQTAFGGAELGAEVGGHRFDARITQPFDRQEYAFALRVDGELQAGSDPQPDRETARRAGIRTAALVSLGVAVLVVLVQIAIRLG